MNLDWLTFDLAAQITTILAFFLALAGFVRERRSRKELERRAQILVWSDISKIRGLMTDLEKPLGDSEFDFGKHQAVGKLTLMYRDKVRHVYDLSPKVTVSHLAAWRKSGKIASDWQESCFWEVFPQSNLDPEILGDVGLFSSKDELPTNHTMAAKPDLEN